MLIIPDPQIDQAFPFKLECLLCGTFAEDILPISLPGTGNLLVRIQDHLMEAHGANEIEFLWHTTEEVRKGQEFIFSRPNGQKWLKATRK